MSSMTLAMAAGDWPTVQDDHEPWSVVKFTAYAGAGDVVAASKLRMLRRPLVFVWPISRRPARW
jgi:hypothetical protein